MSEECKSKEKELLSVAKTQTKTLEIFCDDKCWSRGESSVCSGMNFSHLSCGVCSDGANESSSMEQCKSEERELLSIAKTQTETLETLCDDECWSRGESSVCPGINSSHLSCGVCSDGANEEEIPVNSFPMVLHVGRLCGLPYQCVFLHIGGTSSRKSHGYCARFCMQQP